MERRFFSRAAAWAAGWGMVLASAPAAHAAAAGGSGWIDSFNMGSGALIINPVVILIQWANFLVLLILLNAILYKPLRALMAKRSAGIEGNLASAHRDRSEAQGYVSQYEDSLAEIQRENTEALLALQQEVAEATRKRLEEIRAETGKEIDQARAAIAGDVRQARQELQVRARGMADQIANRLAGRQIA